ncbi:MAG: rRNA maturation RNase YbeY [Paludibacteraceae bacterium]|nr:rRNA maturation RNase YbeY [Paludibacteraceae bacterium]
MITYHLEGVEKPKICTRRTSKWVKEVAEKHGKIVGEIAYIFCSDEYIIDVNRKFLNHDYYTDVITFDYSEGNKISGDIFISLDTVKTNADTFNQDYYNELERIIIHGILHLCGFKDKDPKDKEEMTFQEDEAIKLLIKPLKK